MDYLLYVLIPLITAFIGWLTNWVAIQMLFRPRKPLKILGARYQGLIPKNQERFAQQIGRVVERELINKHSIKAQLEQIDLTPHLESLVKKLVQDRLAAQLKQIPLVGGFLNESLLGKLETMALEALNAESGPLLERLAEEAEGKLDVSTIVAAQIRKYDLDKLESLIREVANRELKKIEHLGGVIGFIVGIGQVGLMIALS